jgi:hypothetical protein
MITGSEPTTTVSTMRAGLRPEPLEAALVREQHTGGTVDVPLELPAWITPSGRNDAGSDMRPSSVDWARMLVGVERLRQQRPS